MQLLLELSNTMGKRGEATVVEEGRHLYLSQVSAISLYQCPEVKSRVSHQISVACNHRAVYAEPPRLPVEGWDIRRQSIHTFHCSVYGISSSALREMAEDTYAVEVRMTISK